MEVDGGNGICWEEDGRDRVRIWGRWGGETEAQKWWKKRSGDEVVQEGSQGGTANLGGGGMRQQRRRWPWNSELRGYSVKGARRGGSLGGGRGGGTMACGGDGGGGGTGWSSSPIFLEQPLEREFTPFFLLMTTRVCGGSLPLL